MGLCWNPQNIFPNALLGLRHVMPPPPPLWHPPGAITPEKLIRHNRKSEGAVRGDRHCPLRKQVLNNLLKTHDFYKAKIRIFQIRFWDYFLSFSICNKNSTPDGARVITMDRLQKFKSAISDAPCYFWPRVGMDWHITWQIRFFCRRTLFLGAGIGFRDIRQNGFSFPFCFILR